MRPLIAVSQGDAVGIGPEVILAAAAQASLRASLDVVVFGDLGVLTRVAREQGSAVRPQAVARPEQARGLEPGQLAVLPCSQLQAEALVWGQPGEATDRAQLEAIRGAFSAVRSGAADALCTAPIRKTALDPEGAFPGHTELLAHWCGDPRPVMMLAGPHLKVIPLTTHLPLAEVAGQLSQEVILHTLRVSHAALGRFFGLAAPRIAVAGLNPHAGEGGRFGDEEQRIIAPAIAAAQREGIQASGPWPADAVFNQAVAGGFDLVLGMYHDQALIPLKLLDFDRAVNVTLGLSIIRTSVDHGTAYDIAGRGQASPGSMVEALRLAADMARAAAAGGA